MHVFLSSFRSLTNSSYIVRTAVPVTLGTGIDGLLSPVYLLPAWYVFSALGFFPIAGTEIYVIGSPIFEQAVMHLPGGDLKIIANGASDTSSYVESISVNGTILEEPWFYHHQIVNGGTLHFNMSSSPPTQ